MLQPGSLRGRLPVLPVSAQEAAGVATFRQTIGDQEWQRLRERLASLNEDIVHRGIVPHPGTTDRLLTGYAYHEFYDWDVYFENLYLSEYGVSTYCFTNFKVFLARQQPGVNSLLN